MHEIVGSKTLAILNALEKEGRMDEKIKEIEVRYPNTTCCNPICFAEKLQSEQHIKELESERECLSKWLIEARMKIVELEELEKDIKQGRG
jgi:hypothetical protein